MDTVHVPINGTDSKVRYIGVNARAATTKKERLGPEATVKISGWSPAKTVSLVKDVSETDGYRRLLRVVL